MNTERKHGICWKLCNFFTKSCPGLCNDWDELMKGIKQHPLGFYVYLAILLVVCFILLRTNRWHTMALFIPTWTAAFFAYKSAQLLSKNFRLSEQIYVNEKFVQAYKYLHGENTDQSMAKRALNTFDNIARSGDSLDRADIFGIVCEFIKKDVNYEEKDMSDVRQCAIDKFLKTQENESDNFYKGLSINLQNANMENMDLQGINMQNANLKNAILSNVKLSDESDFSGANMNEIKIKSVTEMCGNYTNCEFQNADISGSYFKDAILDKANFNKAEVSSSLLMPAKSMDETIVPADAYNALLSKHKTIIKGDNP